jgi:hypothetical protein
VHVDEDLAEPAVVVFAGSRSRSTVTRSTIFSTTFSAICAVRAAIGCATSVSSASSPSSSSAMSCALSGCESFEPSR